MVVHQGDVYWADLGTPLGSEPGYRRPVLVLQSDNLNDTRIATVVVCILTTNMRRAEAIGNVTLAAGEAGLPRPSIANVTQIYTLDRSRLGEYVGALAPRRLRQVLEGVSRVFEPRV
ncbi:MAG: type II toxin-antitoxin system PemK/MazF family toxin [Anaerolineae bacterium]|jgi:mRNA interferase MazF|nr:type II toxin-antitoxin system PemK/MazF family toxin [Anaerolineae bacterium]